MFGRVLPALNPASGVCRAIYVGMFDEVDEGTAIFKVSNTPPEQGYYATYEGLPADWYLRLTAEGSKVISGERPNSRNIPISP
jgi:hypothetical protein